MPAEPIVPDFTPVTPEQLMDHVRSCTDCRRFGGMCVEGDELFHRLVERQRRDARREANRDVDELVAAGWRFLIAENMDLFDRDVEPWAWRWRSPPRRKGSDGRLHHSTGRALGALRRSMEVGRETFEE